MHREARIEGVSPRYISSDIDEDVLPLDLHFERGLVPRFQSKESYLRPSQGFSIRHIELRTMKRASDNVPFEYSLGEFPVGMGAVIGDREKAPVDIRDEDLQFAD